MTRAQETTDSLLTDRSDAYMLYMKLKETEHAIQQYCFHFQSVQWGKNAAFVEYTASEISVPVIQRDLRTDKKENRGS